MKKLLIFITILLSYIITFSQTVIGRQTAITVKTSPYASGVANALIWLPQEYSDSITKKYALIIYLHGAGETGTTINNLSKLVSKPTGNLPGRIGAGLNPQAISPLDNKLYKFIVVSPQAANFSFAVGQLKFILPDIISKYRVDTTLISIWGMSAGGAGAWSIYQDTSFMKKIGSIVPMSAAPIPNNDSSNIKKIGIYGVAAWADIRATDADGFTPYNVNYVNNINRNSPVIPALITLIPGIGHDGASFGTDTAYRPIELNGHNAYEWVLSHKRTFATDTTIIDTTTHIHTSHWKLLTQRVGKDISVNDSSHVLYHCGDTLVIQSALSPYTTIHLRNLYCPLDTIVVLVDSGHAKFAAGDINTKRGTTTCFIQDCNGVKFTGLAGGSLEMTSLSAPYTSGGVGVDIYGRSSNIEVEGVYIHGKSYGFTSKNETADIGCDTALSSYEITNLNLHDNIVTNNAITGFYLGSTDPNTTDPWRYSICNGDTVRPHPSFLRGIRVHDNIVDSLGRNGILLSGAKGKNKIYNNRVKHIGYNYQGYNSWATGIITGAYTSSEIYGNVVKNTLTDGITSFGSGNVWIHDNLIDSSGILDSAGGYVTSAIASSIWIDTRNNTPIDSVRFKVNDNRAGFATYHNLFVYDSHNTISKVSDSNTVCNNLPIDSANSFNMYFEPKNVVTGFTGVHYNTSCQVDTIVATPPIPIATPVGGSFSRKVVVTLSDNDTTALIYYTIDGTDPITNGILYDTVPITLKSTSTTTITLKAVAFGNGVYSEILTQMYNLSPAGIFILGIRTDFDTQTAIIAYSDGSNESFPNISKAIYDLKKKKIQLILLNGTIINKP